MTARIPRHEYEDRVARAQHLMREARLSALLLTTEADIRYFTGFLTRFWESPTRPWFLVVPAGGAPVAVIPSIGAHLMGGCAVGEIRTWSAPDYRDDGVSLLAGTLIDLVPEGGMIGIPAHPGTHLRMPLDDWAALVARLEGRGIAGDTGIVERLRMVKSETEIALVGKACAVAERAFARVPEIARAGASVAEVFRRFQALCLEEGADWVQYLAGGAGPGGYDDVISPAPDRPLAAADVLMLDTGVVCDGYFCDFDRNFSVGPPSRRVEEAHALLIDATRAGFEAARPGVTVSELYHVMDRILTGGSGQSDAGRLGHGLGMQLTEPPSLHPDDRTELVPGMILTLEPVVETGPGRILVHEENIVIRENGAEWLTAPAEPGIPVL